MPVLQSVAWRPFAIPFRTQANAAHGRASVREGIVVAARDTAGRTTLGEASPLPSYGGGSVEECLALLPALAQAVVGRTARDSWCGPLDIREGAAPGSVAALRCGLETAIAGMLATEAGKPLFAWLNQATATSPIVPVSALVDDERPAAAAAVAARLAGAGFRTLKLKLGFAPDEDVARMAAVRSAVGAGVTLRADANGAWSEEEARPMLRACARYGFSLVEQPVAPSTDAAAMARLRAEFPTVAIAADEGCRTLDELEALLLCRAVDAIVVKPMMSGLRESLRILAAAHRAKIPAIVTTSFDTGIGVTLAAHLAAMLPEPRPACGLSTLERLTGDVVTGTAKVVRGEIQLGSVAGLGVELDEQALERVATSGWLEVSA